jgi:chaperonin GroEL
MDTTGKYLTESGELDLFTYDAKAMKVVSAFEAGLLDPTKVTRTALENAASVAGTILTTESVIFEKKDEKSKEDDMMSQYQ